MRLRRVFVSLGLVFLVVIGAVVFFTLRSTSATPDMNGRPANMDILPSKKSIKQMDPSDTGLRFKVPRVHLDVPVGSIKVVHGVIAPPGFNKVYLLRNMGVPYSQRTTGTVYVATHSLARGGMAPGNYLTDISSKSAKVSSGDLISLGDATWKVTGWRLISKRMLATDRETWLGTPGRLVIITCMERPHGALSTENLVIYANLLQQP